MRASIFKKQKYTFSDYFELNYPAEELLAEFGYSLSVEVLKLPMNTTIDKTVVKDLKNLYYQIVPKITLNSEMAKREFLIAPLLLQVLCHTQAKLNVEYPLEINDKLGGSLDYLLRAHQQLIIIEAKKGDLDKGFNQLAIELIALDQYEEEHPTELLYGVITIGEVWRFSILQRPLKRIVRDLHSYRIPEDTELLFSTLVGILQDPKTS